MGLENSVNFSVNGKKVVVKNPNPKTVLGDFLRGEMGLKGLQMPCRQGGCGACTVVISGSSSSNLIINSCLMPLCSVDGFEVTTIEGVGSLKGGLAPVQQAIVDHNGTQCGFCTPGMIMSFYGLISNKPHPTSKEIEDQIDGNICRCTGYRPIFDAFQSFAGSNCQLTCGLNKNGLCQNQNLDMEDISRSLPRLAVSSEGEVWIRPITLQDLYAILKQNRGKRKVRMVRGNTSTGVYPGTNCDIFVDISRIPSLIETQVSGKGISIGGAVSISDFMLLLKEHSNLSTSYLPIFNHLKRVASPQVRSVGSVVGNLMMAHQHGDFVSDIATVLMAADAKLTICWPCTEESKEIVDLERFFRMDMEGKVITKIHIPVLPSNTHFVAKKVALRKVNSHPILNAAFKIEVDGLMLAAPIIVYGGVRMYPQRAWNTEKELSGRSYTDPQVFNNSLFKLQKELGLDPSFRRLKYRTKLINHFFYNFFLSIYPKAAVPLELLSTITQDYRRISSGTTSYGEGDSSEYPVSLPLPKLSSPAQATGEAEYLDDLKFDSLQATYVLSTVPCAVIEEIDPYKALALEGVVAFLSADTIAADGYCNNVNDYETVFASNAIQYHGQAVGLIVAVTKAIADAAAKLVIVKYKNVMEPVISIKDAIRANSFFDSRGIDFTKGNVDSAFGIADIIIEGEVQQCVSVGLNRPQHKITVNVKRVGGGYGAKLNRTPPVAMACAMAADMLQKPVRLLLDLGTNMQLVGGRSPYLCQYKVGAQRNGRIIAIQMRVFNNQGSHFDFEYPDLSNLCTFIDGVYNVENWKIEGQIVRTNLPACTYMRGPVFVETAVMIETILEHVSHEVHIPADIVRDLNMYNKGDVTICGQNLADCDAKVVFQHLRASSDYINRSEAVKAFNEQNKWVKRGISLVPVKFGAAWEGQQMTSLVNIHPDASISIYQSGCEIGQGLDIKVAQVAAMTLGSLVSGGILLEDIYVHTTTTIVANNVAESGGSVTSELSAKSVQNACEKLVKRLEGIRKLVSYTEGRPTWHMLISMALDAGVDLQARGRVYPGAGPHGPFQYVSFAAAVTEAEVNILSGETTVLRVDVVLDCGKSLNPAIDIGQVQGAFVQGLGYHLTEKYVYDKKTGKLVTDGTWNYKPPSSKDIPIVFNASLLPNSSNPYGILRSKFSGEPPYATACSALFAVRQAIAAGKLEWGDNGWFHLNSPATVEEVALAADVPSYMLEMPAV